MTETGWIDDIFHNVLDDGDLFHLEEILPHLKEVIAKESEERANEEMKKQRTEFLADWKWGALLEDHCYRYITIRNCSCPHPKQVYWKWFEKKWEGRSK